MHDVPEEHRCRRQEQTHPQAEEEEGDERVERFQNCLLYTSLLAIFTFLAAALTCTLLFVQDRNAPHYIKIYENEQ